MKTAQQSEEARRGRNSVKVHIDELVLHGFAASDRYRIAQAVERELTRLIDEGGPPGWRQNPPVLDRMVGGTFHVKAGAKPQAAGTEIAQAVFRSLQQHARASARPPLTRPGLGGRHR